MTRLKQNTWEDVVCVCVCARHRSSTSASPSDSSFFGFDTLLALPSRLPAFLLLALACSSSLCSDPTSESPLTEALAADPVFSRAIGASALNGLNPCRARGCCFPPRSFLLHSAQIPLSWNLRPKSMSSSFRTCPCECGLPSFCCFCNTSQWQRFFSLGHSRGADKHGVNTLQIKGFLPQTWENSEHQAVHKTGSSAFAPLCKTRLLL